MNQARLVADLTNDMVLCAFFASVLFIACWTALGAWWRTEIGRAMVTLDAGLALALGPSVLRRLLGVTLDTMWFAWYFLASLVIITFAIGWRTAIIVKTQWRQRKQAPRQRASRDRARS